MKILLLKLPTGPLLHSSREGVRLSPILCIAINVLIWVCSGALQQGITHGHFNAETIGVKFLGQGQTTIADIGSSVGRIYTRATFDRDSGH